MSKKLAQTLIEKRKGIWEQAKALTDLAETEKRELTAEEDQTFQRLSGEMNTLSEQAQRFLDIAEQNAATEAAFTRALGENGGQPGGAGDRDLNKEFRQLVRGEVRSVDIAPVGRGLTGAVETEARALTKGTATAGGNLVSPTFYGTLVEYLIESAAILQLGPTVLETGKGEDITVPIVTAVGNASLVPEAGTIPQADPAFGKRALGAYKYAQLALVSRELIDDSEFDLQGFLSKIMGRNLGLAFNTDLAVGNGSSKPAGIIPSATVGVTGGTGVGGAPTPDNLIDLFYSVTSPYRNSPSAGWLAKDTTMAVIRKFKDTTGQYLFQPSLVAGTPDTLLGKPIKTDPNIAAVGLGGKSLAFGDFSAYFVRMVRGVRFERSDEFKFDSDQVAFRAIMRGDGLLVDQTGAIKTFVGGAS